MYSRRRKSYLVSNKMFNLFSFPREDGASPRQSILKEYCPNQLTKFREVRKFLF